MSKRPLILALALGVGSVSACSAGPSTGGEQPPPPRLIADAGVTIKEIALYQAVKRPLMAGNMPAVSAIPVVAGRDALLRVFVDVAADPGAAPDAGAAHALTAWIYLDDDTTPIEVVQTVTKSSTDADLTSTINVEIPGAKLTPTTKYRVVVGDIETTPTSAADAPAYPATGTDPIPAESIGDTLKVVLAPIAYGSAGALPALTDAQIQLYKDGYHAMYPAPNVEITVRSAPIAWKKTVDASGNGWSELLDHVAQVRLQDKVGADVYYFALFAPTKSFGQFCNGGCVAGLGLLGSPGDNFSRAAIGLGYGDPDSIITALHETGHNHGRQHSPCGGADGPDPKYPYAKGVDGVWGYNSVSKKLFTPSATDIMGYCDNVWISDFTFKGLFDRIKLVNTPKRVIVPEGERDRLYERALVNADGTVQWLSSIRLEEPPTAEAKSVVVESAGQTETLTGSFFRFDHLDGGILFWPASERQTRAIRVDVAAGKSVRLAR